MVDAVWCKAELIEGNLDYRIDYYGSTIQRSEFGKSSDFGWEIDHILPLSEGGSIDLDNLRPLHWKNFNTRGMEP